MRHIIAAVAHERAQAALNLHTATGDGRALFRAVIWDWLRQRLHPAMHVPEIPTLTRSKSDA